MKVLLIKHPTTHFKKTAPPVSGLPLGILSISATLRKAGHDVSLYDAIVGADEKRWGAECGNGVYRMGATWEEIRRVVDETCPDVVGISNQYSSQLDNAILTARVVKEVSQNITVVVGGPHASVMPSSFFEEPGKVEFAVMGEGERTMLELITCLESENDPRTVDGLAFVEGGRLVLTKKRQFINDLDTIPLPAYELLDMERYFYFNQKGRDGRESYRYPGSERSVSMITSRGCPFKCIFCSIHLSMGRKFRAHSVDYVLNHIRHLRKNYHINHLHFEDDNFSFDMSRFDKILDGILANRFGITWDTPNGVRADYLNAAIIKKCKESKCTYLRIGVESANEDVNKKIVKKHLRISAVNNIARLCEKAGIDLEAFYIIGLPGETVAQMQDTIDFAIHQETKHGLTPYGMFTATPLIGTELYKICLERGYLAKELSSSNMATATQGEGIITTGEFCPGTLKMLLNNYRRRHLLAKALYSLKFIFMHPRYLINRLLTPFYWQEILPLLKRGQLILLLNDLFSYRYKNCVVRKIGIP
jgi:anaerobic magnesium-protoporphyrin IX monomethyl ester cyclase